MTPQHKALDRIVRAARCVTEVADQWNAADLSSIGMAVSVLERSSSDLSGAFETLKESPVEPASLFRSNILALKKAAVRLERLVGFSAAFLRMAPGMGCEDQGIYQAGGSIRHDVEPSEVRGMQV